MAGSILVQAHAIYDPFDQRETGRLRGYVEDVEELISSRFFGEGTLSLSISIETGGSVTSTLQYPGEEALRAVVGLFRQLYNHHEPTSYHQILKLLSGHVLRDSEHRRVAVGELREFRDAEKEALKPKLALDLRGVSPTGDDSKERSYTPAVLIDLFLHGKYLHKGNEKSDQLAAWPQAHLTQFAFYDALASLTELYCVGANVVREVLKVPELLDAEPAGP